MAAEASQLVALIQSENLDPTDLGDIEKLRSKLDDPSVKAEDLQRAALAAVARLTAKYYAAEAAEKGVDLNVLEQVEKLCKEIGDGGLSAIEVQGIALHADDEDDAYFESLPGDMAANIGELNDEQLEEVAGGYASRRFVSARTFRPTIRPLDPRIGDSPIQPGGGGVGPVAATVKVVVKGNF